MCGIVITVGAACVGCSCCGHLSRCFIVSRGPQVSGDGHDRQATGSHHGHRPACGATGAFDDPSRNCSVRTVADPRTRNDSRMSVKDNSIIEIWVSYRAIRVRS